MNRKDVLDTALGLIQGDRAAAYGDHGELNERIAMGWSAIAKHPITALEVDLMMIFLKSIRATVSPDHVDNYLDIVGYAALAAEFIESVDDE